MPPGPTPLAEADLPWIDFEGERYAREPIAVLAEARSRSPLARSSRGLQVLSYSLVSRLAIDPNLDSTGPEYYRQQNASDLILEWATNGALPLIQSPRHDRIKKVLMRGFGLKRLNELRPTMRSVANSLLDRIAERGNTGDLVADFSHWYPLEVLCALIGVPRKDIGRFSQWTVALGHLASIPLAPHIPRIDNALANLFAYFRQLVAMRRAEPTDDFVSTLVQAQAEGEELSEAELYGALVNLLFAGHDTTRYQFGWVIQQLMAHRDQWDLVVANPELAAAAVEESMRTQPSITVFLRVVVREMECAGVLLPVGTFLNLNSYAANHDPEMFPDPEVFDIRRKNANRQLTFGYGPHLCLGNALARIEMTEALQVFAQRYPGLELAGTPEIPEGQPASSFLRGAERIPIALNP